MRTRNLPVVVSMANGLTTYVSGHVFGVHVLAKRATICPEVSDASYVHGPLVTSEFLLCVGLW